MPPHGISFGLPQRLAREYEAAIAGYVKQAIPPKHSNESFEKWIERLVRLSRERDAQEASTWLASRMVRWVNVKNAATWRQAAARAQRSKHLSLLLEQELKGAVGSRVTRLVRENARLISTLPLHAAEQLNREIARAQQQGARPETIAKMARARYPQLLRSRINLISRTETQKASTELTRARSEALGLEFYIWSTSEDQRVRESHIRMDGVVIPWHTPPAPEALVGERSTLGHYHAGECPNCRCTQIVVLTLDDIRFPAEVYWQGRIVRMKKAEFRSIVAPNLEERAA